MFLLRLGLFLSLLTVPSLVWGDPDPVAPAVSATNTVIPSITVPPVPAPAPATTSPPAQPPVVPASTSLAPTSPAPPVPPAAATPPAQEQLPTIAITDAPSWVKPIDSDSVSIPATAQIEDGVEYILIDRQQRMDPPASFSHFTWRPVNEQGLQEASDIRSEFDPSYQTFTMHWLKIKRGGVWQDRLPSEHYQVLRREENLDSQMLDGRYSVVYHLEDVRVGDIVDFAYTITGANPVFDGKFATSFGTTWASPVHLMSSQIITPPNRKVSYRSYVSSLEPTHTTLPDQSEVLTWKKEEIPATYSEASTPQWYDVFGWVQVSEYASWKEVIDWALAIYPSDTPLSPELNNKILEISKANASPEDRALAVIAFVQDEIRYLGVEMGPNSYKPTSPSPVFEHRFGDCKDKAVLCVAMLRAMGIEAYPALINTGYRQKIPDLLPSPLAFDHVIVQLIIDKKTYWIDATRSDQRGRLRDHYVSDYKEALVLKPGNDALVPVELSPDSMPHEVMDETFVVKSATDPVLFQIHSTYSGLSADGIRSSFASSSREKIAKSYRDYYADHYPKIKSTKDIRFTDHPDQNRFEVWEEYSIPDFWTRDTPTSKWKATFSPYSVTDSMGSVPSPQRVAPYHLNYPADISENLEVRMFEKWNIETKPNDVNTTYFTYSDHPSLDDTVLHFDFHYKSLTPDIPPADMTDYHDQLKKIKDSISYVLTYQPSTKPVKQPFRPNWMAFSICGLLFGLCCYIAFRVYSLPRDPSRFPPPPPLSIYEGIRGWLILVLIGFILRGIIYLKVLLVDYPIVWDATRWNLLTIPGLSGYDPLWAPALLMEVGTTIVLFITSILGVILMLQKRALFIKVAIFYFSLILIYKLVDTFMASHIPYMVNEQKPLIDQDFYRVIVQSVIWIPYFFVSKRVKATFWH